MTTVAEKRQEVADLGRRIRDYLYERLGTQKPTVYRTADLAEHFGLGLAHVDDHCQQLQELGILERKVAHGHFDASGVWKIGRTSTWTLPMPREEAIRVHEAWLQKYLAGEAKTAETLKQARLVEARKAKTERVIVRPPDMTDARNQPIRAPGGPIERIAVAPPESTEETRAIAGPEAPSPFAALAPKRKLSDAEALVAAAKQYANRSNKLDEQISKLLDTAKQLGLTIDEVAVMGAITLERDERLETISLVLPVIEFLENRVASLVEQVGATREKARAYDQIAGENRRLKARVEGLISERITTAQRAQA